jgi:hypothetical protein
LAKDAWRLRCATVKARLGGSRVKLAEFLEAADAPGIEERMTELKRSFPGAHRSTTVESRLGVRVWKAIVASLCGARPDSASIATALGSATIPFPFEGGIAAVPAGERLFNAKSFDRLVDDILRSRLDESIETRADPAETERLLAVAAHHEDVDLLRKIVGEDPVSRFPMWATYRDGKSIPPVFSDTGHFEQDWANIGQPPPAPRFAVIIQYSLNDSRPPYIPTICNAFAGSRETLNECFQPSDSHDDVGRTARCFDHYAPLLPEVVHSPISGTAVVNIEKRVVMHA